MSGARSGRGLQRLALAAGTAFAAALGALLSYVAVRRGRVPLASTSVVAVPGAPVAA